MLLQVDQAHNWIQERFTHTCDQMGVSAKPLQQLPVMPLVFRLTLVHCNRRRTR